MNYADFLRRIQLPPAYAAPTRLTFDDIVATPISRANLDDDVRGINASIALIQNTRSGGWPTEPVTKEFSFVDLVWHECEFRDGHSFTYAARIAPPNEFAFVIDRARCGGRHPQLQQWHSSPA